MATAAQLIGGQARGTPGPGGAARERRAGPQDEEGSGPDFSDRGDRPPRRGVGADNQGPAPGGPAAADSGENAVPSSDDIGKRLKDFIGDRGQGLKNMYGEPGDGQNRNLEVPIRVGEEMARNLITKMGCPGEVAKDLTVLTLYNVAILIGTFFRGSVHSSEFVLLTF